MFDGFLSAQENVRAVWIWTSFVGFHRDRWRKIVVLHHEIAASGHRPDALVAISRHDVAHVHLTQHRVAVHHAIEFEMRTATIDVVAIYCTIPFEKLFIFLVHRANELLECRIVHRRRRFIEQRLIHRRRERLVAGVVQMKRIDRERFFGLAVTLLRSSEEVDELHAIRFGNISHRAGIIFNVCVVRGRIDEIRIGMLFLRDGRKEHDSRSTFAAVILLESVLDQLFEVAPKFLQAVVAFVRFIVAKEGKDHVGLFFAQPVIGRAESFRA